MIDDRKPEIKTCMLEWSDVSASVAENIPYMNFGSEISWFQFVHRKLQDVGLLSYTNEIGRHLAAIRFITLEKQFVEFSNIAFSSGNEINPYSEVDFYNLSLVRLGQMIGPDFEFSLDDQDELLKSAVDRLVEQERNNTYRALLEIFGDEGRLFVSLWMTSFEDIDYENFDKHFKKHSEEILDIDDIASEGDKLEAYNFVNNGML